MASWNLFTAAEPQIAARAAAVLGSTTNAVLGTLRADGSPRLSGIDPFFASGELWIGSMPGDREGDDLRRDSRVALHSIPWESRRLKAEGISKEADAGGSSTSGSNLDEADVKLAGCALLPEDPDECARLMAWFVAERGFAPPGGSDLFRIDLASVVVISVTGDQLTIDRWVPDGGRVTVRRS